MRTLRDMTFIRSAIVLRQACAALAAGLTAISLCAGCVRPRVPLPAPGQSVSWLLRVGPQNGEQPIACDSSTPPPCVIPRGMGEQRIEATVAIFLPRARNHMFTGEVLVGFVGTDIGPAGHALRVDQMTAPDRNVEAAVLGLVTFVPGMYPIRIRLEQTGPDLPMPRHHAIDVMVQVR
jgi:hypothetical protein